MVDSFAFFVVLILCFILNNIYLPEGEKFTVEGKASNLLKVIVIMCV